MRTRADHGGSFLPRYLTSFVGRQQEIAEITSLLLRLDVRLLTLTGPGGAGKTRLATEVVNRLGEGAWDDIWFVPLVAVRDPEMVLPAMAQALGVSQATGRPVDEAIAHVLRDRRVLLVVDNFETVTAAAPAIGKLLADAPGITMLVTSRVALHISGEHLFVVHPMELPGSANLELDHVQRVESVQLFLERANASGRALTLDNHSVRDITRICRRLDGLPLALELAAARCAHLSPAALLHLLQHGPGILSGGPHDAPERHRSMHDAIAWSYDLLAPHEQAAFRRLSVFDGGFTLPAAEAVVDLRFDILGAITSLADKSLIVSVSSSDDEPRFTMLETLREYGQERLADSPESSAVSERHAAWFLTVAEESDFAWCMALDEGLARIRRLHAEQANIRAALAWHRHSGNISACLHMASQLGTLWVVLGNSAEGQRWLEELLQEPNQDDVLRAKGLAILSWISNQHGLDMKAFELAEEGLAIYRAHDIPLGIIQCLVLSGVAASMKARLADMGLARHQEAIRCMKALREPAWIANWIAVELLQVAQVTLLQGSLDEAGTLIREAWDHQAGNGARFLYGDGLLLWSGHLARARGDDAAALRYYQQTLDLARRGFHVKGIVASIAGVAGALAGLGEVAKAARLFGAAGALHETSGIPFTAETFDIHRALGLPPPWVREDQPFGVAQSLRDALAPRRSRPLPPVHDHSALDRAWAEGRALSLDEAINEALAATTERTQDPDPASLPNLSAREMEVLRLVADGHSNRAIADSLFISERTVEHHVQHILAKLELPSRTAAATFAVRNGVL